MIGTSTKPIPRNVLKSYFEPILKTRKTEFKKVVPTLVLLPSSDIVDTNDEIPQEIKTVLKTKKGETFEESIAKCSDKAVLLNFCTSSLEIYPKNLNDCQKIYNMNELEKNIVPNEYYSAKSFLEKIVQNNNSINPYNINFDEVLKVMSYYSHILKRTTWYLAFNKSNCTVSAMKLNYTILKNMLMVHNSTFISGDELYYEETFNPAYRFCENDYILMDLENGQFKKDKFENTYVRIVNEQSFEMTYNLI